MERDFGAEMIRSFGPRLRRIYDQGDQTMPHQIVATLSRLHRSEAEGTASAEAQSSSGAGKGSDRGSAGKSPDGTR